MHRHVLAALLLALALAPTAVALTTTSINQTSVTTTDAYYEGRVSIGTTARDTTHTLRLEGDALLNASTVKVNGTISLGQWGDANRGALVVPSLAASRSWTLPDATGTLSLLQHAQTWTALQTFGTNAQLDGATITSGTVAAARLPATTAYTDAASTWTALQTFGEGITISAAKSAVLSPTATGLLPAASAGAIVYDGTTHQLKIAYGAAPSYDALAQLGRAQTWSAAQTFAGVSASSVTNSGLTSGRVSYSGTGGLMVDDADFTYTSGDQLLLGTTSAVNGRLRLAPMTTATDSAGATSGLHVQSGTTDASGAAITSVTTNAFNRNTLTAGASKTLTYGATVYVDGTPIAGTNVAITNPYSIYVGGGLSRFDQVQIATSSADSVKALRNFAGGAATSTAAVGRLAFGSYDTATLTEYQGATITGIAAEAWTPASARGTDIVLSTAGTGGTTITERLRAGSAGVTVANAPFVVSSGNLVGFGGTNTVSIVNLQGSLTAVGGQANGIRLGPTLVASANSDSLRQLNIGATTYNVGAFTGVSAIGLNADLGSATKTGTATIPESVALNVVAAPGAFATTNYAVKANGHSLFSKLEIDGELDHDGTTIGFFGVAPTTRQANIAAPIGGLTQDLEARARISDILAVLDAYGFTL